MAKYDIWSEGYLATGMEGIPCRAQCFARGVEADSFKEAVRKHFTNEKGELDVLINLERLTYWGCRLFPTEEEARKSFG